MAIDPSIALSGIKYQAPDLLNDQYKAISLASMLDQRRRANEEADRKMWLERAAVSDKRRSDYARQIAGTKATKDGKLDKTTYISELLRQGMLTEAKDAMSTFSEAEKRDEEAKKINMETRKQALSTGFSLVQGVYELGQQYGYDHPVTINANQHAVQQYNNIAQRIGMDPVPIPEGPVDPAALQGAMEGFKNAEQRMKEFEALPPEVRAGMTYDRTAPKQGQGEVETVMKAGNAADIDSISPEAAPAGVEIQTFNPEQIRPLEEGGNIPGEPPKLLASADYQTTQTNVPAPPKESMGRLAMVNAAKGKPEMYMWDENGKLVRNDSMYQDKLKLAKAGATNVQQTVQQKELSKEAMKTFVDDRNAAVGTQDALHAINQANEMINNGIYTGSLADWRLKAGKLFGMATGDTKKEANTETFLAHIGEVVIPQLKMFGGNDSNEELKYLQSVYAGRIEYEEAALRRILESAQKKMERRLKMFNEGVDAVGKQVELPGNIKKLEIPPSQPAAQPPGSAGTRIRKYNPETGRIE